MSSSTFGRVDDEGNVYVTDDGVERLVGAFPDVSPEEALAYFQRKFDDIVTSTVIIERRIATGATHNARELTTSLDAVEAAITAGVGVGDFSALRGRVENLRAAIAVFAQESSAEQEQAREQVLAERTRIVEAIEALAASDQSSINWKKASATTDELFAAWQATQQRHIKIQKTVADDLWKRFRNARTSLDRARRAHFAQLDAASKGVKTAKEALVAKAEALSTLAPEKAIAAYRDLLAEWKVSGRASKKVDDALWAQFKAAGDALYQAKKIADSADDELFAANLEVKRALLVEGQPILSMTNREQARALLSSIQKRWESAGKVPRAAVKEMDAGLRSLEQAVKKLDDDAWHKSDPEKVARSQSMLAAIENKIASLEAELAKATAAKDQKRIEALTEDIATQRSWISVLGN